MRVFISYAFSDEQIMNLLRQELNKYGIETYVAVHDLRYGEPLGQKIEEEIEKSDALIVILTRESAASPSVNQELAFAKAKGINIIPLLEKGAKIGVLLRGLEYLELKKGRIRSVCEEIVRYLRHRTNGVSVEDIAVALSNILVDETKIVKAEGHEQYDFDVESGERLRISISSDVPISVYIVDEDNFRRFDSNGTFDYDGQEYVTRWNGVFTCEETGEWTLILDNEGDEDAKVDIKVIEIG